MKKKLKQAPTLSFLAIFDFLFREKMHALFDKCNLNLLIGLFIIWFRVIHPTSVLRVHFVFTFLQIGTIFSTKQYKLYSNRDTEHRSQGNSLLEEPSQAEVKQKLVVFVFSVDLVCKEELNLMLKVLDF